MFDSLSGQLGVVFCYKWTPRLLTQTQYCYKKSIWTYISKTYLGILCPFKIQVFDEFDAINMVMLRYQWFFSRFL